MASINQDQQIRLEIFNWIQTQISINGDVLPWASLSRGFEYNGLTVPLIGPSGIWKPELLVKYPISITTSPNSPYPDRFSNDGSSKRC